MSRHNGKTCGAQPERLERVNVPDILALGRIANDHIRALQRAKEKLFPCQEKGVILLSGFVTTNDGNMTKV